MSEASLRASSPGHCTTCVFYEDQYNKGVCHTVALPFAFKKKYLKAKEELWKLKYFTKPKYDLQKILQKKPKSLTIL
jgi:hypothetical protein